MVVLEKYNLLNFTRKLFQNSYIKRENYMLVTKKAPEFSADAVMPDGSFKQVSLSDYAGKKVVLFFYPLDFTYV